MRLRPERDISSLTPDAVSVAASRTDYRSSMDKWGDHGEYEGIDADSLPETPWFPYLCKEEINNGCEKVPTTTIYGFMVQESAGLGKKHESDGESV